MDNNMLERIENEINLCFSLALEEENYKESLDYNAAKILISTYNKLVKLYYQEEYWKDFLKKNVEREFRKYKNIYL